VHGVLPCFVNKPHCDATSKIELDLTGLSSNMKTSSLIRPSNQGGVYRCCDCCEAAATAAVAAFV
jgi:hypothetical protein